MTQLICHLFGDYVFQNQVMATRKRSSWLWAMVHVFIYSLVFLAVMRPSWSAMAVIAGTHLLIDRFALAGYWIRFYGIGRYGLVASYIRDYWREDNVYDRLSSDPDISVDLAYLEFDQWWPIPDPAPDYLAVWLTIIVDNSWHLAINSMALTWL